MLLYGKFSISASLAGMAFLFGTAALAGGYHVEFPFVGGVDGAFPQSTLTSDGGKLYGTTVQGGAKGKGTMYSFDPATGAEAVVHSFEGGGDGEYPYGNLITVNKILYGMTQNGGSNGYGTVYRFDVKTGAKMVLYSFKSGSDGAYPQAGLVKIGASLYGVTYWGGGSTNCQYGCGTVFSFDIISNVETVIYRFSGGSDIANPNGNVSDINGKLYGTAYSGGSQNCYQGCGGVYSVDLATGAEVNAYVFQGGDDGGNPIGLTVVGDSLYGTAALGGATRNGIVYSVNPGTGNETVVYPFAGGSDGSRPEGSLINVGGALYGTTVQGGHGRGTVFSVDVASHVETVLHAFRHADDGSTPLGGLYYVQKTLWGTTNEGGDLNCAKFGCGTVFTIKP